MSAAIVPARGFDAAAAPSPRIDVIIAVHDLSRPVARTLASALATDWDRSGAVRVTVACHELDADDVAALLPEDAAPFTRLLEVRDGLGSPSGPYNAGMDVATAELVTIIGSDDYYEPGALQAWSDRAGADVDVVLAPMRMQTGEAINTPRVRPRRTAQLDPVADRMAYRTAPLGLMRLATLNRLGLRLDEGMKVGGDIAFTVQLWRLAPRVDLAAGTPAYVVGVDASTRVTTTVRPLAVSLAPYTSLLARDWFMELPARYRRAVAIKILRIHVLDNVARRASVEAWGEGEVAYLRRVVGRLVGCGRGVLRPFSRADRLVFDTILDPSSTAADVVRAATERSAAGRWAHLLPPAPWNALDRESTARYYVADRFRR